MSDRAKIKDILTRWLKGEITSIDDAVEEIVWMGPKYRHARRGTSYALIGDGQVQAPADAPLTDYEVVAVYKSRDGGLWVRRKSEFDDGRFEEIKE